MANEVSSGKCCIVCSIALDANTTTWYRQKNYIHKCNDCVRAEKARQGRKKYNDNPSKHLEISKKSKEKLRRENPKKYTAIQQAASSRKRAMALGLSYDLAWEYLLSISPDVCPVFFEPIKYGGGERDNMSASLDRIDPSAGYVEGNVRVISNLANIMKNNATHEQMVMFAEWVLRDVKNTQTDRIK